MKPARSPAFQSAADRVSIVVISACFFCRAGAFRLGAAAGSSIIGAGLGIGGGDGGYIGSIMPGPGQLLSEKSFGSSIGSPLLVVRGAWLIAYPGNAATQVRHDDAPAGVTHGYSTPHGSCASHFLRAPSCPEG